MHSVGSDGNSGHESLHAATSYSLVVSPNANLSGALVSQEISTTAFNFA